jgi:hypothetical protein
MLHSSVRRNTSQPVEAAEATLNISNLAEEPAVEARPMTGKVINAATAALPSSSPINKA